MRSSRWLLCSVLMACTHHAPPPSAADPKVGALENPCPAPKTARADAAEYERLVATSWCRSSEGSPQVSTEEMTFGKDGREVERAWITEPSGQRHGEKERRELCWRLEGTQLHEVRIEDGRDFETGHEFDENGALEITVYDMGVTYRPCPPATR